MNRPQYCPKCDNLEPLCVCDYVGVKKVMKSRNDGESPTMTHPTDKPSSGEEMPWLRCHCWQNEDGDSFVALKESEARELWRMKREVERDRRIQYESFFGCHPENVERVKEIFASIEAPLRARLEQFEQACAYFASLKMHDLVDWPRLIKDGETLRALLENKR